MSSSVNTFILPRGEKSICNNFITFKNAKTTSPTSNTMHSNKDDVFHKYTILEKFGSGTMCAIYKVKLNATYSATIVQQHHTEVQVLPETTATTTTEKQPTKRRGLFLSLRKTSTSTAATDPTAATTTTTTATTETPTDEECLTKIIPEPPSIEAIHHPSNTTVKEYNRICALKCRVFARISEQFLYELRNEIAILQHIDHPNIIKAYEVYTIPHERIFLVMECCTGGDLYTRQTPPNCYFTESIAAHLITQILSAVCYMHKHGVVHRDLKRENILFESTDPNDYSIKIIDFGLSKQFKVNPNNPIKSLNRHYMHEFVGTISNMSPQVIQGKYTSQADIWAIGVICYILLSYTMPFHHEENDKILDLIKVGNVSFNNTPVWDDISNDAKHFISQLLLYDPDQRLNASSALQHCWIQRRELLPHEIPSRELLMAIDKNLLHYYSNASQLKKIALFFIAHRSTTTEISELRKVFRYIDTEKNGNVTFREFKDALLMNLPENEVASIFAAIDLNRNGNIDFTEFLAATIEINGDIEECRIMEAFDRIDSDEDGYISRKNLQEALGKGHTKKAVDEIMLISDLDRDGKISYSEFLTSFREQASRAVLQT